MIVNVRMLAYQPEDTGIEIRPVKIPDVKAQSYIPSDVDRLLDDVFYHGQNEHCNDRAITSTTCSVSMGDVVELRDVPNAGDYLIMATGFHKLTEDQYKVYKETPRRDRVLNVMSLSEGRGI